MNDSRDWRSLPYFQNETNMQAFTIAEGVYGQEDAAGRLIRVYGRNPLTQLGHDARIPRYREVVVPFDRARGELELLRDACREIKGRDDYDEHDEEGLRS